MPGTTLAQQPAGDVEQPTDNVQGASMSSLTVEPNAFLCVQANGAPLQHTRKLCMLSPSYHASSCASCVGATSSRSGAFDQPFSEPPFEPTELALRHSGQLNLLTPHERPLPATREPYPPPPASVQERVVRRKERRRSFAPSLRTSETLFPKPDGCTDVRIWDYPLRLGRRTPRARQWRVRGYGLSMRGPKIGQRELIGEDA